MKVKLEFEIEELEAIDLLNHLRKVSAQVNSQALFNIVNEIEKDINISGEIGEKFIMWLSNYARTPISIETEFKYDLRIADWWLASKNGLARLCNLTLRDVKNQFGGSFEEIQGKEVSDKKNVKEVIEHIISKYDA